MTEKRRLYNELVCEVCNNMHAATMSDQILFTSFSIRTYLTPRFPKKSVYRDAIGFIRAKLNSGIKISIRVDPTKCPQDQGALHVVRRQYKSAKAFELLTNYLRIQVYENQDRHNFCSISNAEAENAHLQYFVRLIAPLLQPIPLDLLNLRNSTAALVLNLLGAHMNWVLISAKHFASGPIQTALGNCSKLSIHSPSLPSLDQRQQFRCALIQWLNGANDGQTKMCSFPFLEGQEMAALLAEIKTNFYFATRKRRFAVHISLHSAHIEPFRVRNRVGEKLELGRKIDKDLAVHYALIRRPIAKWENNKCTGLDFDGIGVMTML